MDYVKFFKLNFVDKKREGINPNLKLMGSGGRQWVRRGGAKLRRRGEDRGPPDTITPHFHFSKEYRNGINIILLL